MTPEQPLVTYMRVSTSKQGRSGLGLAAQRAALIHFAQAERFHIVHEFVEVDSGKGHDALDRRPQLRAALAHAKKRRCHLGVAKLDRLSRDVHFISELRRHGFSMARSTVRASQFTSRRTLQPGDIVIMDNLGSHKSKAVRALIRSRGAKLFFLPKYSPT